MGTIPVVVDPDVEQLPDVRVLGIPGLMHWKLEDPEVRRVQDEVR